MGGSTLLLVSAAEPLSWELPAKRVRGSPESRLSPALGDVTSVFFPSPRSIKGQYGHSFKRQDDVHTPKLPIASRDHVSAESDYLIYIMSEAAY